MKGEDLPHGYTSAMRISARRLKSDIREPKPEDCVVELMTFGEEHRERRVRLSYDGMHGPEMDWLNFDKFASAVCSQPWRKLAEVLDGLELSCPTSRPEFTQEYLSTVESLAVRAACLIYPWLQLDLFQPNDVHWTDKLCGRLFLEPRSEQIRNLPYLYFLPQKLNDENRYAVPLQCLYSLHLLSKLEIYTSSGVMAQTWFKPLVVPGVIPQEFKTAEGDWRKNYGFWRTVISELERCLSKQLPKRRD
jgi:hypothetical protein